MLIAIHIVMSLILPGQLRNKEDVCIDVSWLLVFHSLCLQEWLNLIK